MYCRVYTLLIKINISCNIARTATGQKAQHQRCCAIPELWRGDAEDGKVGFEKEILKPGTGPKPVKGQKVTVHCTGYGWPPQLV
jgi:FKBP-type peptidyl-prolyl cis-trans isomerase